jgi:hypothetical protein
MAMRERIVAGLTVLNLGLLGHQLLPEKVGAQNIPAVVRARAWELVDTNGPPHASLDVSPQGDVVLPLRDDSGTIRVKMSASRNGSGLLLLDAAAEPGGPDCSAQGLTEI